MAYGVVRTDNLAGTTVGKNLVSVKFHNGTAYAACENGMPLALDAYLGGDVFKAVQTTANMNLGKLLLTAGVELFTDYNKGLDQWINPADIPVRAYVLQSGDIFSVTVDALDDTPTLTGETPKKYIGTAAQAEWDVQTAATNAVAECIAIEGNMYVYRVL